jgi:hypothetical protein
VLARAIGSGPSSTPSDPPGVAGHDRYEQLRLEAGTATFPELTSTATLEHGRSAQGKRVASIGHEAMGGGAGRLTADPTVTWTLLTTASD